MKHRTSRGPSRRLEGRWHHIDRDPQATRAKPLPETSVGRSVRRWALVVLGALLTTVTIVETQTSVTLQVNAAPTAGQPGIHTITLTGSGFPAGSIVPADVTVTLQPAGGPSVQTTASAVRAVAGSTRQVLFQAPASIEVAAPTVHKVRISGRTTTGTTFASTNAANLTLNPPARIVSLTPASVEPGQTASVVITSQYTDFANLSTLASFGPGVTVGGAAEGAFGRVTVTSKTSATAQIAVSADAPSGFRTVTVKTGVQQASIQNVFAVETPNRPPVANPGGPYAATQGHPIAFSGVGSSDPDDDPLVYAWTFGDGETGVGAMPVHTYKAAGEFTVTLTVSDGRGGAHSASTTANVSAANRAPAADAGGPYAGAVGQPIALDGSGSTDPDGQSLTYAWSFGDGQTATGATPQHTYAMSGQFTVTLTVIDAAGAAASVQTTAIVAPLGPDTTAPFVSMTAPREALPGSQVVVTASANDNVGVVGVTFVINDGGPIQDTSSPYEQLVTIPLDAAVGSTFTIKATAADVAGNTGKAQAVIIVAAASDTQDPEVVLNAPPQVSPSSTIQLSAAAADNVGIKSVAFLVNGAQVAIVTAPPYQTLWVVPPGTTAGTTLTFTAVARDTSDRSAEDAADTLIVAAPDATPPSLSLSAPSQAGAGRTLHFGATAGDNVGVAAVQFFVDDVLVATDTAAPYEAAFPVLATAPAGAVLALRARAIDFSGLDAVDAGQSVVVANRAPVVQIGGPYSGQVGDLVVFDATASTDPDGDALAFTWTFSDNQHAAGPKPSRAFSATGTFTVTLEITDGRGGSATAQTTVAIAGATDRAAPAISLTVPAEVLPGTQVGIVANAADNVGVVSVAFSVNAGAPAVVTAAPYAHTVSVPDVAAPGTLITVRATATDAAGNATSVEAVLRIVDVPDNTAPAVSLTLPPNADAGGTVRLIASVTDQGGVSAVVFFVNDTQVGSDVQAPFEASFNVPGATPVGSVLQVSARATDFSGNQGQASGSIPVVEQGDTTPPTVTVAAPETVASGATLHLSATALDNVQVASVAFYVDGVLVATDTRIGADPQQPYKASVKVSSQREPGTLLMIQARAVDFAGLEATAAAQSRVVAAGLGVIAGEVYDGASGLPLAGVTVVLSGKDALDRPYDQTSTSDSSGRYIIRAADGDGLLTMTKPEFTTASRSVTIRTGRAVAPVDARLTPFSTTSATIEPALGGTLLRGGYELALPPSATTEPVTLTLTPVGQQGLQGLLPPGWSPLAAVDVAPHDVALRTAAIIRAPRGERAAPGASIVLARWDAAQSAWRAVTTNVLGQASSSLEGSIEVTGQYAWLLADTIPLAPPLPADDAPIEGIESELVPSSATTIINPEPKVVFYRPGARSDVGGIIRTDGSLPSGTLVRARITESYKFFAGGETLLPPYVSDLTFFQAAGSSPTQAAFFPVTPSLIFEPATLERGVITVELLAPTGTDESMPIVGSEGGTVRSPTGEEFALPPGASTDALVVRIERLTAAQLGLTLPTSATFTGGAMVTFDGSLTTPGTLSVGRPADITAGSRLLLARVDTIAGESRLVLVGTGRVSGDRIVSETVLAGAPTPFDGVRAPGRYVFLRMTSPIGFAAGAVIGTTSAPFSGGVVRSAGLPGLVSLSSASGAYIAAAPAGQGVLEAEDVQRGDVGMGEANIVNASVVALNLTLVARPPQVTSVTPANHATQVPLAAAIVVRFSEPIDPATVTGTNAQSIRLMKGTVVVAGALTLSGNNTVATFRPAQPLDANSAYTVSVSQAISDRGGYSLIAAVTAGFTSIDTSAPAPQPGAVVKATIPVNGQTSVTGSNGAADPSDEARLVNKTRGTEQAIVVRADGSFEASIAASLTDKLEIRIRDAAGNETVLQLGRYENADGTVGVGPEGGVIEAGGLRLTIAPGTFPSGSAVKFTPLPQTVVTAETGADYPFVAAFELNSSAAPQIYMNVSVPAPAGATNGSPAILAEIVNVYGHQALSMIDTATVVDGRVQTSSPPCPGLMEKFGRYAVFLNQNERMQLGMSLLSLVVPRQRSVVLQGYSVNLPFIPGFQSPIHPPLQYEQTYNPALPFINYIRDTGDVAGELGNATDPVRQGDLICEPVTGICRPNAVMACLAVPSDQPLRVVVRDAQTGAVLQSTPQQTAPPSQVATVRVFASPDDTEGPRVVSTPWSPQPPYVLDAGKPLKLTFSEPVTLGLVVDQDAAYLLNQLSGDVIPVSVRFGDGNRAMTLTPQRALPMGVDFFVKMPGVTDFVGNPVQGAYSFRTFKPFLITPFQTEGGVVGLDKTELFAALESRGFRVPSQLTSAALKDIDFITKSPDETLDGKWQTTLFGIGNSRNFGFQILAADASTPTFPTPVGALAASDRFYTRMKVLPAFAMTPRMQADDVPQDPSTPAISVWRSRQLHYLASNPQERICGLPGSPQVTAWRDRQPVGATIEVRTGGCGDLGLVTSYTVNYGLLHAYDLTDPTKPELLGQRLLNDGGGVSGFPRKREAPEGNGAPRGFGVITGVDITHQWFDRTAQHANTTAVYVANQGVGMSMLDLDWNVPSIWEFERVPQGAVIESLGSYAFPYYNDATVVAGRIVSVAADRIDGTGTAHLEVFDPGLNAVGPPVPLPLVPYAMTAMEDVRLDLDGDGTPERHDYAVITGQTEVAIVEIPQSGVPQVVGFIKAPVAPQAAEGQRVMMVTGACPSMTMQLGGETVVTNLATRYRRGTCSRVEVGDRLTVVTTVLPDGRRLASEVTFVPEPENIRVTALRYVEIDRQAKTAYVSADWTRDDSQFSGLLALDVSNPYGGMADRDNDGWDDRVRGLIPIAGAGQPVPAGTVWGIRFDAQRKLIYAALESLPSDHTQVPFAIVKTCDCRELSAEVTLRHASTSSTPNQPSADGESATLYVTDQDFAGGQVHVSLDVDVFEGARIFYRITEVALSEGGQGLLQLPNGEIRGELLPGTRTLAVPLRALSGFRPGSLVMIEFTGEDGRLIKRIILRLVPTRIHAPDVVVRSYIDRANQEIYETPAFLNFTMNHDAKVTIRIDGLVIAPVPPGQTTGAPFQDVPLAGGANRVLITRDMVSVPGKHAFEIRAAFQDDITTVQQGTIEHDVVINESLPVGHSFVKTVDVADGHVAITRTDIDIPSVGPALQFGRTYSSTGNDSGGAMGAGWSHNLESRLAIDGLGRISVVGGEGGGVRFTQAAGNNPAVRIYKPQAGYHGSLVSNGGAYDYYTKSQMRFRYTLAPSDVSDPVYRLAFIEDPSGNRLTLEYDAQRRLAKVADAAGRALTFTYAPFGNPSEDRITRIDGPLGLVVQYSYDAVGNLISATRSTRVESYAYTTDFAQDPHNLLRVTDPNGNAVQYTWYAAGDSFPGESGQFEWGRDILRIPLKHELVKQVTEGEGTTDAAVTRFAFDYSDLNNKYVTTVTDPRGTVTRYTVHPRGAVTEIRVEAEDGPSITTQRWAFQDGVNDVTLTRKTEPNGRVSRYEYDDRGNRTKEIIEAAGLEGYAPVTNAAGAPISEVVTSYEYHPKFNRPTKKTDPEGNVTLYEYDGDTGHLLSVTTNPGDGTGPIVISNTYGDFGSLKGLLKTTRNALDKVTTYVEYDQWGNATSVEDPEGNATTNVFDARSRLTESSDTMGRRTTIEYDELDRPKKTTKFAGRQPQDNDMQSADVVIETTYFPNGEKRTVTDGLGHVTELTYDALNRLRQEVHRTVDADGAAVTISTSWEYDGAGNRRLETNGRGIKRQFTWDRLQRLRKEEIEDGGGWKTLRTLSYDAAGNVTAETDVHGHTSQHQLDALYRRVRTTLPIPQYTIEVAYDLVGNELRLKDANGNIRRRTFDGVYRRRSETDPAGNRIEFDYDKAGNVIVERHTHTGLVREFGPYDGLNRPLATTIRFTDAVTGQPVAYSTSVQYLDGQRTIVTTNARGHVLKEVFNGLEQVIERVADPDGLNLKTTYRYDANGNQIAQKDSEGSAPDLVRVFDGLNRKIRVEYPLGGIEKTYYDGVGNAVRTVDRRGIVMRHEFDAQDRKTADVLVESISNGGQELVLASTIYDDAATTETRRDANGQPAVKQLDAMHREVRVTDALDRTVRFEWDGVNRRAQVSRRGIRTEYDYDALNRVVAVREFDASGSLRTSLASSFDDGAQRQIDTDREGAQRIAQYDALGRMRRDSRRHATLAAAYGAVEIAVAEKRYDGNNNVVEDVDARGNVTKYEYDAADRRERIIERFGTSLAATTTFTYDRASNVLTVKDGRAHGGAFDVRSTYDERNRKITETNGEGEVVTYTYTADDQPHTVTEAKGGLHVTTYKYDELNKLLAVDTTRGAEGGVTRYLYDGNRNKIAQQDANGNLTTYVYDAINRLTETFEHFVAGALTDGSTRASGVGGDAAGALHWHFEYDPDGNQTAVVDAEGQRVVKAYDHLNRVTRKEYANHRPASDGSTLYPQLLVVATQYDGNGNETRVEEQKRLDAATTVTEVTVMTYDRLNRLTSRTNFDNKTVTYTYDRQGNRSSVTDSDSAVTTYTYDASNRVETVTAGGGETRYTYWPDGLAKTTTYPNGSITETTYDAADRPVKIVNHAGDVNDPISQYDYTYDDNGNRLQQIERHRQLTGGAAQTTTYGYDALNRLLTVSYADGSSVAYTYAPNGNRLTEVGTDAAQQPINRQFIYNRVNQLVTIVDQANAAASVAFVYDRNGNTRAQRVGVLDEGHDVPQPVAVKRFEFDVRDQLVLTDTGAGPIAFDHDYTGLRTMKSGAFGSLRFVYDERSLLQEYDPASGVTVSKYNYGGDRLVSLVSSSGGASESFFYLADGLRSTSELTDASGAIRASYVYDAFGGVRQSAETTPNRRRFTGHYEDTETGLQYFGARYYDPAIGRFLNADTFLGNEQDPPSLHRYMYAHANPLLFIDPTGHSAEPPTDGSFGAWISQVGEGAFESYVQPIADMLESGARGLADVFGAGIGMLAIEATGTKYIDEIGGMLDPVSNMGKLAAANGTWGAVKEAASGFVTETYNGIVTIPDRLEQAALSGDPKLLGATVVEVVETGRDLKGPLAKVSAPVVKTFEQATVTVSLASRRRVSKRDFDGVTKEVTGTFRLGDAWELAALCVAEGAHGCGVYGGLTGGAAIDRVVSLAQNVADTIARKPSLAMGKRKRGVKYHGDLDFGQYRKDAAIMNNQQLAFELNSRTTAPLIDPYEHHGVMGEFLPARLTDDVQKRTWWREQRLTPGTSIRAYDYWKVGITPPGMPPGTDKKAFLYKPGTTDVTTRDLELNAWDYINTVHTLRDMPMWPGFGALMHQVWVQDAARERREK